MNEYVREEKGTDVFLFLYYVASPYQWQNCP